MKHRIPEVIIGEPMAAPVVDLPSNAPSSAISKLEYEAHIQRQILEAATGTSDADCPIRQDLEAHPEKCTPPGQGPEFLVGFIGGLLYAIGVGNSVQLSAFVNHILGHVLETVARQYQKRVVEEARKVV